MSSKIGQAEGISKRIRVAMKEHDIATGEDVTWAELGRRVGAALRGKSIDSSTLSRWKKGQQEPGGAELIEIGKIFGVDPGWLYFGEASLAPAPGVEGLRQSIARIEARINEVTGGDQPTTEYPKGRE